MASAASVDIALGLSGMGEVLGGLSVVERALGTVGRGAGGIVGGALGTVGGVVAGVGTAVVAAGTAGAVALGGLGAVVANTGVGFLAMREQAQVAFTTMLGSGAKATAFLDQLQSFAAATPFEFPDLVLASQRLLAMGITADKVIPTMTAIGDAVAALGGDKGTIDRVTLAIGQMNAKGRVQADEMMQLTEAGIPAWQYLATAIGTDIPTAMDRVSKGAISASVGINAITTGMERSFGGMMDKQSGTWNGLLSTMADNWRIFSGTVMQPIFDTALKPGLTWLTTWMSGPGQALGTRLGQGIAGGMQRAGAALRVVLGVVGDFRDVLNGGTGGGGLGGTLAVGFLLIKDTITNRVLPAVRLLWAQISGAAGGVNPLAIILGIAGAVETVGRWFQLGVDAVVTFRQALAGVWALNGGGNDFVNMVGRIGLAFRDLQGAFDAGGWSAFFGTLWTGYVQPALGNLWTGITTWIATQGPGILQQLGTWAAAFGGWFQNLYSAYILPWLGVLWTQFDQWIGQQTPLIIGKLAEWGGAFINWAQTDGATIGQALWDAISGKTAAPLTPLALGTIGDMNGVIPQTTNSGIAGFLDTLNTSIQVWGATTGHQAMTDAIHGLFIGQGTDPNDQGGIANLLNSWNTAISTWAATTGHAAIVAAFASLGQTARDAFFSDMPDWLKQWLNVDTGGVAGNTGGSSAFGGDAPTPGGGSGSGGAGSVGGGGGAGLFTAYGFKFGTQGGGPITLNVTVNGITPGQVAQEIYDNLAGLLGEPGGGGAVAPASPAGTVY